MIFIENENNYDPKLNLALEEYAVRNFKIGTDYILLYINEPAVIVGRNQNILEEINYNYIKENSIHVIRRVSGGGTVYHDLGNLNYSFISNHDTKKFRNFKNFTYPIIKVLKSLGLDAKLTERNDIQIKGKKISGTAQFSTGKKMISHGTLLFNSDLNEVTKTLQVKMNKIESKGHKSVRSSVANISDFMENKRKIDISGFKKLILDELSSEDANFNRYSLSKEEWEKVHQLKKEKYDTWEWNYGKSPKFNIKRNKKFKIEEMDLSIFVEKGYISDFKINGNFKSGLPIEKLENQFIGLRYEKTDIDKKINDVKLSDFFKEISAQELSDLIHGEDC